MENKEEKEETPELKCCECGRNIGRTLEESIERGLPPYTCDVCITWGSPQEDHY